MTLRIGISSCLLGEKCNFDGKDLFSAFVSKLSQHPNVQVVRFCPEDSVFGTPRPNLRIVGGDGYDVLDGRACVLNEKNEDVTEKQIAGARRFLEILLADNVQASILMDGSPSCGSNVLLQEKDWPRGGFKKGAGVTAALLRREGLQVFSSFDLNKIDRWLQTALASYDGEPGLTNLSELPKFRALFSEPE